ncbi:MAG: hypothetical protein ACREMH_06035 [Gemmatimonadales bacterium]
MIRSLVGYAVFAALAILALKLAFKLLGFAFTLFWALLWLAFIGFIFYLILRLFSPSTADQVRDAIKGRPGV